MEKLFITAANWQKFLFSLSRSYRLITPPRETPVKTFFFAPKEIVAAYSGKEQKTTPFALIDVKACDLASLRVLDSVFIAGDFVDPIYEKARRAALLISTDCVSANPSCFCTEVGGSPYPEIEYDINVTPLKEGLLVESSSEKGKKELRKAKELFSRATEACLKEQKEFRERVTAEVKSQNQKYGLGEKAENTVKSKFDSPLWKELARPCVNCTACTNICPTCFCFLLSEAKENSDFVKIRTWDSCIYQGFQRVAGGANPRKEKFERLRNRLFHKFVYIKELEGIYGCTGCGRCIEACMGGLDTRESLEKLKNAQPL